MERETDHICSTTGPDVLKDINLKIRPGERVAICGRTGSGKSTLAALVVRLLDTRVGSVSVGEHTVSQFPPDTIRGRINSLPQDAWFLPGDAATVRANLDPLHEATDEQIQLALEKTGLSEQVDSMGGLDSVMRGSQLSVGQRQLMCLARAMVMKRKRILLLDEATSSVDIHTEEKMMELLRTEFRGWTVVAIVHRLKSVVDFDRVVVLDAGRIIENDSPQQLLADESSAFAKLFRHTR
ncbi:hypothetical protein ANO11243_050410 [Dothideomycetidae sp. 11243]|nr:hypothetical protein ANO11243_050410 [fungal sp. No.11243]